MSNTMTIAFHIMRKAGQGRILHAVTPVGPMRWAALCGTKTSTKWVDSSFGEVVTCPACLTRVGLKRKVR